MSDTAKDVVEKCEFWIRVHLALEVCVKEALIDILNNIHNDPSYKALPINPADLFKYLKSCLNKKVYQDRLDDNQRALLCPASGLSNPREWDITLIVFVIRNETTLKPLHGWGNKDRPTPKTDLTKGGCIDHAKHLRNDLNHGSVDAISTQPQFDRYWNRIKRILMGLDYQNMDKFHELKTASLDKYNGEILCLVTNFKKDLNTLKCKASDNTIEIEKLNVKIIMLEQTLKEVTEIKQKVESNKRENEELRKEVESNKEENKKLRKEVESSKEDIKEIKEKMPESNVQGKMIKKVKLLLLHLNLIQFFSSPIVRRLNIFSSFTSLKFNFIIIIYNHFSRTFILGHTGTCQ